MLLAGDQGKLDIDDEEEMGANMNGFRRGSAGPSWK